MPNGEIKLAPWARPPEIDDVPVWTGRGWEPRAVQRAQDRIYTHTEVRTRVVMGNWQSPDYVSGSDGWKIAPDGSAEFNDITARGTIYATAGEIGGWTINADEIVCDTGAVGMSSEATGGVDWRFWAGNATPGDAPFRVDENGNLVATSATITGEITAETGTIGGWTILATELHNTHIWLDSADKAIRINDETFGNAGIQLEYNAGTPRFFAGSATYYVKFDGTNLSWKGVNTELTAAGAFTASNATVTGTITATDGAIGGWEINADEIIDSGGHLGIDSGTIDIWIKNQTFTNAGIQLQYNGGTPRFYCGDGSTKGIAWDGSNLQWSATNSSLDAAGDLTVTGGEIGGWTITSTTIASTNITLDSDNEKIWINDGTFGNEGIQLENNAGTPRFHVGDGTGNAHLTWDGTKLTWKAANTELSAGGNLTATSATIEGEITAESGAIGGWTIGATTLSSANITLDSGNDRITVGGITLDGAVPDIESSNYVSGSDGFHIDEDFAEFGNVAIRGEIASVVLKYQEVQAVSGSLVVTPASRLTSDAASGQPDLVVDDASGFSAGDLIRLSEGGDVETGTIDSIDAPSNTITLDANLATSWDAGVAVCRWDERILLTSELANSPYVSIVNDAGTEKARLGNLDGLAGDPSGYGLWSDNVFLEGKIVATSGEIGGWTIGASSITCQSGEVGMSSAATGGTDYRFWAGHATPSSAPFSVDETGRVIAGDAVITGSITATSGTIAGWTVALGYLHSNDDIGLSASGKRVWVNDGTFGNDGIQLEYNSGNPRAYIGNGGNRYFKFDGTNISWEAQYTSLNTAGQLTCTSGTIAGWSISSTQIYKAGLYLNSSSLYVAIKNTTFGNDGVQLQYNSGNPRAYIGNGSNRYFKFDGTNISWEGANTSLTTGGAFTASNATITGAITASSGSFTGVITLGASGELRQGTGTLGVDFTGLRIWRDTGVGRIAGYNSDTMQWYADTDGKFYAGGGAVEIDASGITLEEGTGVENNVKWYSGANKIGQISTDWGGTGGDPVVMWVMARNTVGASQPNVIIYVDGWGDDSRISLAPETVTFSNVDSSRFEYSTVDYLEINYPTAGFTGDGVIDILGNHSGSNWNALVCRDAGIDHGFTAYWPGYNFWFRLLKLNANYGGAYLTGAVEDGYGCGLYTEGLVEDQNDISTASSTAADAVTTMRGAYRSGTGGAAIANTRNLFAWCNWTTTRMILKGNGALHLDSTLSQNSWDEHDDAALITSARQALMGNTAAMFQGHRRLLEEADVISVDDDAGRVFVNVQNWTYLLADAIRQMSAKLEAYETELVRLGADPERLALAD